MLFAPTDPIVLASRSAARQAMLTRAGISFVSMPADLDEGALTAHLDATGAQPESIALSLARAKAEAIAALCPGALVVGSDQLLTLDGEKLDKAADRAEARATLLRLSGRTHILTSAACVVRDGALRWSHVEQATMTMRELDGSDIDLYLDRAGPELTHCVGCYALEGQGAWLFDRVEGDFFTILGMPLLPLLGFLSSAEARA